MLAKRRFPRIRLRVGIAVVFLCVMLPLTAMMTALLYRQNSHLAYTLAETAMDGATRDVVVGVLQRPQSRPADGGPAGRRRTRRAMAASRPAPWPPS